MAGHDIICIGASAGGVEALMTIARALPADLPASVFMVLHISPYARSMMPDLLRRAGPLPAEHARHGEAIQPGRIYIAPPDHHLILKRDSLSVTRGPQENGVRPSVDVTFRSAAAAFRNRVVGVVLTGNLDDGTAGLVAIKRVGGVAIVQDPNEAMYPGMPTSAVQNVDVDHVVPLAEIGPLLARIARQPVEEVMASEPDEQMGFEAQIANMEREAIHKEMRPGAPSGFACPDCHGTLFEIREGQLARFRCRVGHAYSPESLLAAQSNGIEAALWTALRALEEKV
ncbi:MAG: two-component system, chemotaxis family, protein-glutamate methylesterase/glutaminase, partial [Phycisphaerales bacterium]|nr:two-component system, chemotaxis family, protein-glutamate methylesterase/glutaminase [Phycisphaerales bacterium]